MIGNKICNFITLYRSPSQNQDDFQVIGVSKQNYYLRLSAKLTKFHKSSKAYWSLTKTFLNNKKIPLITPLYHQGGFLTNFKVKTEFFNSFFASQCSLIKNDSKLLSYLNYKTDNRLSTVSFSIDGITKIVQNLALTKHMFMTRSVFECSNVVIQSGSHWSSSSSKLWKVVRFRLNGKKGMWFQFI